MRIDRLEIENFKCFAEQTITLHPQFTLFVGENGSGKTSVLDALAVAASIWLIDPPDPSLSSSCRNILDREVRLKSGRIGDRTQFEVVTPARITAAGDVIQNLVGLQRWSRTHLRQEEDPALAQRFRWLFESARAGRIANPFPVLAHYSAGRAWLPDLSRLHEKDGSPAMRWSAFEGCFDGRIKFELLAQFFRREAVARGNRSGRWRPGFTAVKIAILGCVPRADDLWFDEDRDEVALSIDGVPQPLSNLSAGQRMMMA